MRLERRESVPLALVATAPLAAVANAVSAACGVRMTELPMSPPKLLKAMSQKTA